MGKKPDILDIQSIYQNALSLHQQGKTTRAAELYRLVLEHVPDAAEVHYNLGLALFEDEQFTDAIGAYNQAAELNPDDSDIYFNLGLACKMARQFDAAASAYIRALDTGGDDPDIFYNLGCCLQDAGAREQACLVYEKLLEIAPDHLSALNNLAYLVHLSKDFDYARELYSRVLDLDPERESAQHMYASLSGKENDGPPPGYIRELFDCYSDYFEENLVNDLEYNTFCILRQAVEYQTDGKKRFQNVLDLGCGTGLSGETFRPVCERLTGIDLSKNMIEQATAKELYDELHCVDIVEFLTQNDNRYDLLIAADVVPYLGKLDRLFAATEQCSSPGALFCFSSEATEKPGWELLHSGRYAHNPEYIIPAAAKNGWKIQERFPANIRREHDSWIRGEIFVLGRTGHKQL